MEACTGVADHANVMNAIMARVDDPDRPFLLRDDAAPFTYGALDRTTQAVARKLAGAGVGVGDTVATILHKSHASLVLSLGILRAGAVLAPLSIDAPKREREVHLRTLEPRLLIADPAVVGTVDRTLAVETMDASGAGRWAQLREAAALGDVDRKVGAVCLFTSGTTGPQKRTRLTHANLLFCAEALAKAWEMRQGDVVLHALPMFHAHGLLVAVLPVLWAGGVIDLRPRFDVADVIARLSHATCFMGVPFHYSRLLASANFTRGVSASVRLFICGSAPLSPALRDRFREQTGAQILERYGTTETLIVSAQCPGRACSEPSVGPPLDGVEVRIGDMADGTPLAAGETGRIEVRGPNVFEGYVDDDAATAASFTEDGYFLTGDLGHLRPDGSLVISGRHKDLIIYCGMNVHPLEVETALLNVPGVVDAAVFGVPHPEFGEAVMAAVVPAEGVALEPAVVRTALVGSIADYRIPKRIFVMDSLPRSAMGKIVRSMLAAQLMPERAEPL